MKPKVTFIGRVKSDAEIITPGGVKRPFLSYRMEGFPDDSGYRTNVECSEYNNGNLPEIAAKIRAGDVLMVHGDATAKAYMSKQKPGTPVGRICVFVKSRELIDIEEPPVDSSVNKEGPQYRHPKQLPTTNSAAGRQAAPDQSGGQGDADDATY